MENLPAYTTKLNYPTQEAVESALNTVESLRVELPKAAEEVPPWVYKDYLERISDALDQVLLIERKFMSDHNYLRNLVRTEQALYTVKLAEHIQSDTVNHTHVMKKVFAEAALVKESNELSELTASRDSFNNALSYVKLRRTDLKDRKQDIKDMHRAYKDGQLPNLPEQPASAKPTPLVNNPFANQNASGHPPLENYINGLD